MSVTAMSMEWQEASMSGGREPEGSTGCNVGEETGSGSCRLCSQATTLGFSPTIRSHRKLWAGRDLFILVF